MGYRIAPSSARTAGQHTAPVKSADYLAFVRDLPCVISLGSDVDPAHLSTPAAEWGHMGRGKARKASDRWVLPLCRKLHDEQHSMNEMEFWGRYGINPHALACALWGKWSEMKKDKGMALVECEKIIRYARSLPTKR